MRRSQLTVICLLSILASGTTATSGQEWTRGEHPVVFSQSFRAGESAFQVDFSTGTLELSHDQVVLGIQTDAEAVARFYGRFPVSRVRVLVVPVMGRHGVLQGTSWGDTAGFPAFVRIRIGSSTTSEELANDWVIIHELVHTALSSLPDDQRWLEEGIASYIEPIVRVQAGGMSPEIMWAGMVRGLPNGEPQAGDQGLDNTHTWGRTYWGGALFCLMSDLRIRRETQNRAGLQDALRAIVAQGATIDTEVPLQRVLEIGDRATGTRVLQQMYSQWSQAPVNVDLPALWQQLGVHNQQGTITLDAAASLAPVRAAITNAARTALLPRGAHVEGD
jgi:hypothetical protein